MRLSPPPIKLDNKREFSLQGLYQWKTYRNLLCGLPIAEINKHIIEDAYTYAKEVCKSEKILLLEPEETPIIIPKKLSYGEPVKIPGVVCVAQVTYHELLPNDVINSLAEIAPSNYNLVDTVYLEGTIVWFQEEYCMPIDDKVLAHLRNLDMKEYMGKGDE